MMQLFPEFYRKKGVVRVTELPEPKPELIKNLPVASVLHVLGDAENPQLDTSDSLMLGYDSVVRHYNVTGYLDGTTGGVYVKKDMSQVGVLFDKTHPGFKVMKNLADLKTITAKQLLVANYGYLDSFYRYPEDAASEFLRYRNKLKTVIGTIRAINAITTRNHFIGIPVPMSLVPRTILDSKSEEAPRKLGMYFPGSDEMFLREMWLFINPAKRYLSVFGNLSEDELKTVNIHYRTFDGKITMINLGYLYSWVKGNKNLTFTNTVETKSAVDVQKSFLRSLIGLQNIDVTGASALAREAASKEKDAKAVVIANASEEESEQDGRFLDELSQDEAAIREEARLLEDGAENGNDSRAIRASSSGIAKTGTEHSEATAEVDIDKDLEALEQLYLKQMKVSPSKRVKTSASADSAASPEVDFTTVEPEEYTSDIPESAEAIKQALFKTLTPAEALHAKLEALADSGQITAAEFRKKAEIINRAVTQPDPYGSNKTITEAGIIKPEEMIVTEEETRLNVPETVIDKSMAQASISVANRKYNDDIIYRDILNCVQGVQKAGVVVRDHTVSTHSSELGVYDIHTLEMVPLRGSPSIIRARIPRLSDDGTFTTRGTKCVLRGGMADVPIRKIGATRVGLTSYYGKTFIDRASRKSNSSLAYILTRLTKATIAPDEHLRAVAPGDVFDNYFEAPYIFSGIAEKFSSFKAGDITFDFNHKGFRLSLDPAILKNLERDGTRICGWIAGGKKAIVVVNKDGNFRAIRNGSVEELGDIYDILNLDRSMAPVDFAEVKIFAKAIPVGIFLGQNIGFRKLVKMLGAKHRLVKARKQLALQDYEYAISFRDVSYVFDRRDATSSLVLAGYQSFHKETKMFDAVKFDTKDVYLRLLESRGLTAPYLTEMENLQELFIDPITERNLQRMNEPTNFNALLVRSCELLQTYYYPDSQDGDYQRIRGYDRFAGFLYKELTQSLRGFKARNRTGRAKVEMRPYQVWTTITRDESSKQCEDINPIQSLKLDQEAVTYVGEGGRGKESMNRASRAFTKSNMGTIDGDSVDSSSVGINIFKTANPILATIDGMPKKDKVVTPTSLLSTSSLLTPFSSNDD